METKYPEPEEAYNLEKYIKILETPFSEVCQIFGEGDSEPEDFFEVEGCVFLFDAEKEHVFSGAIVMGETYGFFGIKVGTNWMEAADKLESQGFQQAEDLERFTKLGSDFNVSVYLYPDDCPDSTLSRVKDYSISTRYGRSL
jgi:hypothetical protein